MIDIGDILHMPLMKGDWVVMNRQPTLHRPSMMVFWVVLQDVKTFKVSLAVTKPLNSDFDGDEINCHIPQNPMVTTEVKQLMAPPFYILSPKNGMPIICHGERVSVDKEKEADRKINAHEIFGRSR